jgi:hypothetical protein
MKIIALVLAFILSGCLSLGDMKKHANYDYSGEVKRDYSALSRCVVATMEAHESWKIRTLQYNVRTYPDIERSEINAHASSMWGPIYAFNLELNKTAPKVSNIV